MQAADGVGDTGMTAKSHSDRLKRMANDTAGEVLRRLYMAGQMIELDAERSITAGSVSGKGHVASSPGQPPNRDTGQLDGSIETEIRAQNPPTVAVVARDPKAKFLEWGTSRMQPRPFMRPATERNRDEVTRMVGEAVSIVIKRG
jgi:HK97 gp10 family phage protein